MQGRIRDGSAPQKTTRVGAEGYLAKPFNLPALVNEAGRLVQSDEA